MFHPRKAVSRTRRISLPSSYSSSSFLSQASLRNSGVCTPHENSDSPLCIHLPVHLRTKGANARICRSCLCHSKSSSLHFSSFLPFSSLSSSSSFRRLFRRNRPPVISSISLGSPSKAATPPPFPPPTDSRSQRRRRDTLPSLLSRRSPLSTYQKTHPLSSPSSLRQCRRLPPSSSFSSFRRQFSRSSEEPNRFRDSFQQHVRFPSSCSSLRLLKVSFLSVPTYLSSLCSTKDFASALHPSAFLVSSSFSSSCVSLYGCLSRHSDLKEVSQWSSFLYPPVFKASSASLSPYTRFFSSLRPSSSSLYSSSLSRPSLSSISCAINSYFRPAFSSSFCSSRDSILSKSTLSFSCRVLSRGGSLHFSSVSLLSTSPCSPPPPPPCRISSSLLLPPSSSPQLSRAYRMIGPSDASKASPGETLVRDEPSSRNERMGLFSTQELTEEEAEEKEDGEDTRGTTTRCMYTPDGCAFSSSPRGKSFFSSPPPVYSSMSTTSDLSSSIFARYTSSSSSIRSFSSSPSSFLSLSSSSSLHSPSSHGQPLSPSYSCFPAVPSSSSSRVFSRRLSYPSPFLSSSFSGNRSSSDRQPRRFSQDRFSHRVSAPLAGRTAAVATTSSTFCSSLLPSTTTIEKRLSSSPEAEELWKEEEEMSERRNLKEDGRGFFADSAGERKEGREREEREERKGRGEIDHLPEGGGENIDKLPSSSFPPESPCHFLPSSSIPQDQTSSRPSSASRGHEENFPWRETSRRCPYSSYGRSAHHLNLPLAASSSSSSADMTKSPKVISSSHYRTFSSSSSPPPSSSSSSPFPCASSPPPSASSSSQEETCCLNRDGDVQLSRPSPLSLSSSSSFPLHPHQSFSSLRHFTHGNSQEKSHKETTSCESPSTRTACSSSSPSPSIPMLDQSALLEDLPTATPPPPSMKIRRVVVLDKLTRFELETEQRLLLFREKLLLERTRSKTTLGGEVPDDDMKKKLIENSLSLEEERERLLSTGMKIVKKSLSEDLGLSEKEEIDSKKKNTLVLSGDSPTSLPRSSSSKESLLSTTCDGAISNISRIGSEKMTHSPSSPSVSTAGSSGDGGVLSSSSCSGPFFPKSPSTIFSSSQQGGFLLDKEQTHRHDPDEDNCLSSSPSSSLSSQTHPISTLSGVHAPVSSLNPPSSMVSSSSSPSSLSSCLQQTREDCVSCSPPEEVIREEKEMSVLEYTRQVTLELQEQFPVAYATHLEHERNVKELVRQLEEDWGVHTTLVKARYFGRNLTDKGKRLSIRKGSSSAFPPDAVIAAGGDGTLLEAASFISSLDEEEDEGIREREEEEEEQEEEDDKDHRGQGRSIAEKKERKGEADDGSSEENEKESEEAKKTDKKKKNNNNEKGGRDDGADSSREEKKKRKKKKFSSQEGIWLFGFNTDPLRSEGRLCLAYRPPRFLPRSDNSSSFSPGVSSSGIMNEKSPFRPHLDDVEETEGEEGGGREGERKEENRDVERQGEMKRRERGTSVKREEREEEQVEEREKEEGEKLGSLTGRRGRYHPEEKEKKKDLLVLHSQKDRQEREKENRRENGDLLDRPSHFNEEKKKGSSSSPSSSFTGEQEKSSSSSSHSSSTACVSLVLSADEGERSCFKILSFHPTFSTPRSPPSPPSSSLSSSSSCLSSSSSSPSFLSLYTKRGDEGRRPSSHSKSHEKEEETPREETLIRKRDDDEERRHRFETSSCKKYVSSVLNYVMRGHATALCRQRIRVEIEYPEALEKQILQRIDQQRKTHTGLMSLTSLEREISPSSPPLFRDDCEQEEEEQPRRRRNDPRCEAPIPSSSSERGETFMKKSQKSWGGKKDEEEEAKQEDRERRDEREDILRHRHEEMKRKKKNNGVKVVHKILRVTALNDIFIGECDSSRTFYGEVSIDRGPSLKQKSSGFLAAT
ncbi:dna-directed rna polymerase iii rpc8, partial [Cystoisospora suis]